MNEGNQSGAQNSLSLYKTYEDPIRKMTCGENLERKVAEQKERLAMLEAALEEMKTTGLYSVKISTLQDTMTW